MSHHTTGSNRREVLLGAGGLAAVAAAMGGQGGQSRDREGGAPAVQMTGTVDTIGPFDVLDVSLGATNSSTGGSGGRGGSGKVSFEEFQFRKATDKSSPSLLLACAKGQHFKKATFTFTFTTRKGSPAIGYELQDVLVTSFAIEENLADRPSETVTLTFSKLKFTVDGEVAEFDLGKNV